MNISAKNLRSASIAGHNGIKKNTDDIFKMIKQDIVDAVKSGNNSCEIVMPTNFDIIGVDNESAQLIIYAQIIAELETKGFKVKINKISKVWRISGWDINVDAYHKQELYKYLAARIEE